MADIYTEVNCSFCKKRNIKWSHFECLVCPEYSLCQECYDEKHYSKPHRPYHPMQSVLAKQDFFKLVNSVAPPLTDLTLCCPYCGVQGLNLAKFVQHCLLKHPEDTDQVKCPVCVTFCIPQNPSLFGGFMNHLSITHKEQGDSFLCDTCEETCVDETPITGSRYMCLVCDEYGQCESCYTAKRRNKHHLPYHPIQQVLPKEVYLSQKPTNDSIYRCPFCGENEFSASGLTDHCHALHLDSLDINVICPICTVCRLPFAEYSLLEDPLLDHLKNYHGLLPKVCQPEPGAECSICLLELTELAERKYCQCSHNNFHDQCIQTWLTTKPSCPVCRANLAE